MGDEWLRKRLETLEGTIATRLRDVCSNLPDESFRTLVRRIALLELKCSLATTDYRALLRLLGEPDVRPPRRASR